MKAESKTKTNSMKYKTEKKKGKKWLSLYFE